MGCGVMVAHNTLTIIDPVQIWTAQFFKQNPSFSLYGEQYYKIGTKALNERKTEGIEVQDSGVDLDTVPL